MIKFVARRFYVLIEREISILPRKVEATAQSVEGHIFHTLDVEHGKMIELGIYRKYGKLYAIVDTYTGLELCTAHLRNDSKQDAADMFERRYKRSFLQMREDRTFYETNHIALTEAICESKRLR